MAVPCLCLPITSSEQRNDVDNFDEMDGLRVLQVRLDVSMSLRLFIDAT